MEYLAGMAQYWNGRFAKEGDIWGDLPSSTAAYALNFFRHEPVKRILVPGAGYGRNSRLLSAAGFDVTGIEISEEAFRLARRFDPKTRFYLASVMDIPVEDTLYDAVYCFNVLHLFRRPERDLLVAKCYNALVANGLAFFAVFSDTEESFGTGAEVEPNTFESKPGRPVHYFTDEDLVDHFKAFTLIETGLQEDPENHGGKPHVHLLRYIIARKPAA